MAIDIEKFTHRLRNQAGAGSLRKCAKFVRLALEAGGASINGAQPADAKDWGPMLVRLGFRRLPVNEADRFVPMKGDIVVIQPYEGGNPSGHIAAFDGQIWISDFRQLDFWSGPGYRKKRPAHAFYRL